LSATTDTGLYREAPALPDVLPAPKERGRIMGFIYRHPTIVIGGTLVGIMVLLALLAPYLWTKDPTALAPARRTREPSALYWFGTDMLGRDVYSRVIYGSQVSLLVGFSVAALAAIMGTTLASAAWCAAWC
jgi:peptide/nickel transport system permease protein